MSTSTIAIARLRAAIRTAQAAWVGLDWDTEYDEGEPRADPQRRAALEAACDADAAEASALGAAAEGAAERGDMEACLELLGRAARLEREYGDDPAWGPVLRMARELAASADEDEEDEEVVS